MFLPGTFSGAADEEDDDLLANGDGNKDDPKPDDPRDPDEDDECSEDLDFGFMDKSKDSSCE